MKKRAAAPYILLMAAFIIVPLLMVAYFAFTGSSGGFTLQNLADVSQYNNIFYRSIKLAVISTVICLAIAYPLSMILARIDSRYQGIILMVVMLPMWMNLLLMTYAWITILQKNGVINSILGLFGLGPYKLLNTQGAIVLGMVYNYLPFMILPIYNSLTKIDASITEAAQDLGCNSVKAFLRVIFPLSIPGVMSGITMVFVPAISTFIISRMLGGGSNILIGDLIEMQFLGNAYNPYLGAAISLILMIIVLIIMTLLSRFDTDDDRVLM